MPNERSVATSLRKKRNLFVLVFLGGFVLLAALNFYTPESLIAFGLLMFYLFGGFIAGAYLASALHCPYCKSDVNGFITHDGTRWYSPQIMDVCWKCHRDLTQPYDKDLQPTHNDRYGSH